jgi:hypothetical protein
MTGNATTPHPRGIWATGTTVTRAEKIYGASIAALKGKTVRPALKPVLTDLIAVSSETLQANQNVSLCGDAFFVNRIPFFTSISRDINFTTIEIIPTMTVKQLVAATRHVNTLYNNHGFCVETAMVDSEFAPSKADLLEMGIILNITSANEHVPEIERRIRVIKERTRATRHTLLFTYIPRSMVVAMVRNSATWINTFPVKGGVSPIISPRTTLTGQRFYYMKHSRHIAFGAYAQVHYEPTPSNSHFARNLGAICLGPAANLQGGYYFLQLTSGQKITQHHWT